MRLTVTSPKAFILKSLEEQALTLGRKKRQGISPTIEFGLVELAEHEMRSLARQAYGGCEEEELLEQAIQYACDAFQARVSERDMQFDLAPYLPGVRNTLQFPAKEIAELSRNRPKAKRHSRVPALSRPQRQEPIPYEIFDIGCWIWAAGFMARPLVEQFDLELRKDSEEYQLEGDWFPFIVKRKGMEFIVNEDGTVFVALLGNGMNQAGIGTSPNLR